MFTVVLGKTKRGKHVPKTGVENCNSKWDSGVRSQSSEHGNFAAGGSIHRAQAFTRCGEACHSVASEATRQQEQQQED